jgi:hypothetical protein
MGWYSCLAGYYCGRCPYNIGLRMHADILQLLFEIMSLINVTVVRQLALVKRIQKKRPVLDTWIEAMCALCWVIVIAMMVFDGIHQYPSGHWDGRLIGLLACAGIML